MVNGAPEDDVRRFVIGFFPDTDRVAVWELQQRNSGCGAGKFREKARLKNPDTGNYFQLHEFAVGNVVTIAGQPLHIIRADEHTLVYLEKQPQEFPFSNPRVCARKLAPLAREREMQGDVDPDRLSELATGAGIHVIDHEIITLLRHFGSGDGGGAPQISGRRVLEAAQAA